LLKETAEKVFPYLVNRQLKIKLGHEYTLNDVAKAHNLIEERLNNGKIILNVE
jgi:NADPH2:quinone reductase